MKINCNNQDFKIIDCDRWRCTLCEFNSYDDLHHCLLFCSPGKIWIKDIFNSDIFRV